MRQEDLLHAGEENRARFTKKVALHKWPAGVFIEFAAIICMYSVPGESERMEQQQFSEVEVDKVVASSNIVEVEESVENSNNMDHNQVVGNPEQESCSLVAGVLEP